MSGPEPTTSRSESLTIIFGATPGIPPPDNRIFDMMMDDEIEYVGPPSSSLFLPRRPATRQPSAVILTMEADHTTMKLNRPNSNVLTLGRRPLSDAEQDRKDLEIGFVSFRCPVVSRKHAEIKFSDDGKVYITDQGSHHGTNVRRNDQPHPLPLVPGYPAVINAGDSIILGKPVQKGSGFVEPLVARISFTHDPPTPPWHKPSTGLNRPSTCMSPSTRYIPAKPTTSGRYGLNSDYDVDMSLSSSESSDNDSDIEELPSKPAPVTPLHKGTAPVNTLKSYFFNAVASSPISKHSKPIRLDSLSRSPSLKPMDLSVADEPFVVGAWPSDSAASSSRTSPVPPPAGLRHIPAAKDDSTSVTREEYGKLAGEIQELKAMQSQLAGALKDLNAFRTLLDKFEEQLDNIENRDMPDIQAQIEGIQDNIQDREDTPLADLPEVVQNVQTLKDLVAEMRQLKMECEAQADFSKDAESARERQTSVHEARIEKELTEAKKLVSELQALRDAARATKLDMDIDGLVLKRKLEESETSDVEVPKAKRQSVAGMMLRTTATITVGAAAAWAALAFS
ncbi:hypothetical protein CYLTODRAFT_453014 [Cylindrobasidium torrendii FP15055 ss-10]|uniref:FHA domain-containing protein n=1 Tax=Cylindrobasidium torrendii FP15055 ss-10 TaxID=1314674 RepID=A0A0D7BFJ9_9AGAR|nr:hypothetical protein CYLTODRAFT_453014 [Cylindrobasidium torrendii FP15055 ss-10]